MIINATEDQIAQIAINAINASCPVGLGFLHAKRKDYSVDELGSNLFYGGRMYIDYFDGRMVKLGIDKLDDNKYELRPDDLRADYQSWKTTYPDMQALVDSVMEKSP